MDKVQWWNTVNMVMNLQVPQNEQDSELAEGLPASQERLGSL